MDHLTLADGRRLAYLATGTGTPVVALHGLLGRGRGFAGLARGLAPRWRVIAPDQRGHGLSSRADEYSRSGYVDDVRELIERLGVGPCVVLGHSLGGMNAYQFAARHPELVSALVVEDIGAERRGAGEAWLDEFPARFDSVRALSTALEEVLPGSLGYFLESVVEHPDGWGFRWEFDDVQQSGQLTNGDWWADWLGSSHPALLLRGGRSDVLSAQHADEMARRRPNTRLVTFPDAGHTVHRADPAGYEAAVRSFLTGAADGGEAGRA